MWKEILDAVQPRLEEFRVQVFGFAANIFWLNHG
jgi:hypothetical protein